jgi:HAD superfamily hydrolase (TIGR01509 family)
VTAPGAIAAVFFDVDFTLIYPGPAFQGEGYERTCARYDVHVDPASFEAAIKASSRILDEVEEPVHDETLFLRYNESVIEQMGGRGRGVALAARDLYDQWATNHHFEMYDDVEPVLRSLVARGLIVGAISNSHRSLEAFREHFSLEGLIHATVTSFEHGFLKPHPSIFAEALDRAGADAATSLMVGDSLKADVGGALAAGMRAVLLRRSGDVPRDVPAGVPVIASLRELAACL